MPSIGPKAGVGQSRAESGVGEFPALRELSKGDFVGWPVVQRGRIEVSAVRPNNRVNFGIDAYLIEDRGIA